MNMIILRQVIDCVENDDMKRKMIILFEAYKDTNDIDEKEFLEEAMDEIIGYIKIYPKSPKDGNSKGLFVRDVFNPHFIRTEGAGVIVKDGELCLDEVYDEWLRDSSMYKNICEHGKLDYVLKIEDDWLQAWPAPFYKSTWYYNREE